MPKNLLIDFRASPEHRWHDLLPGATVISAAKPRSQNTIAWEPLKTYLAPPDHDQALALLKRLNTLCDEKGRRYASIVRYHGFEPWWFHQQIVFDCFLVPYTQHLPLVARCASADRAIICRSPAALRRMLPLMPQTQRFELHDPDPDPIIRIALRPGRRAASWLFYHSVSAAALLHTLVRSPDAIVYSVDAVEKGTRENRWIGGVHQALARRGISSLEILWSASGAGALRNLLVRRCAAVYTQAVRRPERINAGELITVPRLRASLKASRRRWPTETSGPSAHHTLNREEATDAFLRQLAANVLLPAARRSIRGIRRFERLLQLVRPRGAYFMDDCIHAFELVVACKRRNIPTVAVQHGQFGRHTAGLMGYGFSAPKSHTFDRYCVWGDFFADTLREHSELIRSESVVPAGLPRTSARAIPTHRQIEHVPSNCRNAQGENGPIVLVLGEQYEPTEEFEEVRPYFLALLKDRRLEVHIKPHPAQDTFPGLSEPASELACVQVVRGSLEAAFDQADVVVASYTSAIFEAILHRRPVVLFSTSRYDDPHGLASSGLATRVSTPTHLADAVYRAAALLPAELARRKDLVWGTALVDAGEAAIAEMERLQRVAAAV